MGRLIKQGCKGQDVRAVQDVLNFHIRRPTGPSHAHTPLQLEVDGDFGPRTHARVVEFQKSNELKTDGIVGPNTMGKLFEEEQMPFKLALVPQQASAPGSGPRGIQPPRLIPPLTLPPLQPPLATLFFSPFATLFLLPPDSFFKVPALTLAGQTVSFVLTVPVRSDPVGGVDPVTASSAEILRVLDHLPPRFPFRGEILKLAEPTRKVGPLELDPVSPMSFGFKWSGPKPVFNFKETGPPIEFAGLTDVSARYVFELRDKPGALVPQLGWSVGGDFKGTIDWASEAAQSRPLIDLKGSVIQIVIEGRF